MFNASHRAASRPPRFRRALARLVLVSGLMVLAAPAAAGHAQAPDPSAPPSPVADDWPGYELGLRPAAWRVVGHYDGAAPTDEELDAILSRTEDSGPRDIGDVATHEPKEQSVYAFHTPSRTVYELTIEQKDARKIGRWIDRNEPANAGAPAPRSVRTARPGGPEPAPGWSDLLDLDLGLDLGLTASAPDAAGQVGATGLEQVVGGTDSRERFTNTTFFPYRALGNEGACSGTQIGPRHVVTAGHCIVKYGSQTDPNDPNTANWYFTKYIPGRDGDIMPYGGAFQPVWYFVPSGFLLGTGGATSDWGVMTLPVSYRLNWPTSGIGWFDMLNDSISNLKKLTVYNRGYPVCDAKGPVGCEFRTLWGSPSAKIVGTHADTSQMLLHDSDTSDGHSGSAVFAGPWSNPKVLAIHKGPSGSNNWGVRLTQDRIDYIMYMRSVQK